MERILFMSDPVLNSSICESAICLSTDERAARVSAHEPLSDPSSPMSNCACLTSSPRTNHSACSL